MGRIIKFLLTLSIVTYLIGPLSVMAQASTLDTSIGKFSISTIDISSDEIIEKLSTQPWWGNEELAKEFANLAKLNFGVQTSQACVGASYSYELTESSINEALWYQCGEGGKGVSESGSLNIRGETNLTGIRTYAIATKISGNKADPDTKIVESASNSRLKTSIGTFSISTIDISSDEVIEKISSQPWWGNEELAKEFANLAKLNFGVQTSQACVGASYSYELTESSINEALWYQCGEGGKGISESGSLNIRGETNLSGVRTYAVATRIPDTNPRIDQTVVPKIPQQSLPRIVRSDGTVSKSSISIGGSSDNGDSYSTSYTVNDKIVLTAKIYPDEADVGKAGELYVVIRSKALGLKIFKALNEDGKWELWNGSLKKLPPAKTVDELQSMEEINIYSGYMTKGQRLIYVGYSLYTDGKPVITTSLTPLKIEVSE